MEILLKIEEKILNLPVDEKKFTPEKPIVIIFKNPKGKQCVYTLRLTNKMKLVLN